MADAPALVLLPGGSPDAPREGRVGWRAEWECVAGEGMNPSVASGTPRSAVDARVAKPADGEWASPSLVTDDLYVDFAAVVIGDFEVTAQAQRRSVYGSPGNTEWVAVGLPVILGGPGRKNQEWQIRVKRGSAVRLKFTGDGGSVDCAFDCGHEYIPARA